MPDAECDEPTQRNHTRAPRRARLSPSIMADGAMREALDELFAAQPAWLLWGILPLAGAAIGYYGTVLPLELLIRTPFAAQHLLPRKGGRWTMIRREHSQIASLGKQLAVATWVIFGPTGLINGLLSIVLLPIVTQQVDGPHPLPTLAVALMQLAAMELVGDFGLYWGHRVQHESEFLWRRFHWYHHQLSTPSPAGTIFIDVNDATLQAGLPAIAAAALVRPHPALFALYVYLRIAENVVNHSGLDARIVDALTLKFLPGRPPIAHHDAHHLYSNHCKRAKNFGENFWLWDVLFGTYSVGLKVAKQ